MKSEDSPAQPASPAGSISHVSSPFATGGCSVPCVAPLGKAPRMLVSFFLYTSLRPLCPLLVSLCIFML